MIRHPFTLLAPFADVLDVVFLDRSDSVSDPLTIAARCGATRSTWLKQVHGNRCVVVSNVHTSPPEADGILTDQEDFLLSIFSADCQTFIAFDPHTRCIGLLHAGWRGLLAKAIPAFVDAFVTTWHCNPEDLLIGAGPSLCQRCSDFTDPSRELPWIEQRFFFGRTADLRGIAEDQFLRSGIKQQHIERMDGCTRCSHERFWSYRGPERAMVTEARMRNVLCCRLLRGTEQ